MVCKLGFLCPLLDTESHFQWIKGEKILYLCCKTYIYTILIQLLMYVMLYLMLMN